MRADNFINEVLAKCVALKKANLWLPEPEMRPRAWLQNFDEADRVVAATLLDNFTFYSERLSERLLVASYQSLADGLVKGPYAPAREQLLDAVSDCLFVPVEGEQPHRADSGNFMCRMARQILRIPEPRVSEPVEALQHACRGGSVVFLDDFIGSGDQFMATWERSYSGVAPHSFRDAYASVPFTAISLSLICTKAGVDELAKRTPNVAVSAAHIVDETSSVKKLQPNSAHPIDNLGHQIDALLSKYEPRLTPSDPYMANNQAYKMYGYKQRGLMFGFAHSIPDATLPIFWSPGTDGWIPLRERK